MFIVTKNKNSLKKNRTDTVETKKVNIFNWKASVQGSMFNVHIFCSSFLMCSLKIVRWKNFNSRTFVSCWITTGIKKWENYCFFSLFLLVNRSPLQWANTNEKENIRYEKKKNRLKWERMVNKWLRELRSIFSVHWPRRIRVKCDIIHTGKFNRESRKQHSKQHNGWVCHLQQEIWQNNFYYSHYNNNLGWKQCFRDFVSAFSPLRRNR